MNVHNLGKINLSKVVTLLHFSSSTTRGPPTLPRRINMERKKKLEWEPPRRTRRPQSSQGNFCTHNFFPQTWKYITASEVSARPPHPAHWPEQQRKKQTHKNRQTVLYFTVLVGWGGGGCERCFWPDVCSWIFRLAALWICMRDAGAVFRYADLWASVGNDDKGGANLDTEATEANTYTA